MRRLKIIIIILFAWDTKLADWRFYDYALQKFTGDIDTEITVEMKTGKSLTGTDLTVAGTLER